MTSSNEPHLARAVRSLQALFAHTPQWTEARLAQQTQLHRPLVNEALALLVREHHVQQTSATANRPAQFMRAPAQEQKADGHPPLTVQDLRVLHALSEKSDSASHLARQLQLTTLATNQSLELLSQRGLVSIRYVGRLAIYQTTQGWGWAHGPSLQS